MFNIILFQIKYSIPACTVDYFSRSARQGYGPSQAYLANHLWNQKEYYDSARWYAKAAENSVPEVSRLVFGDR